ncbi:hypothetical protein [Aeoliella sp.]|uniref:hypothetical protein n=1 Tax=Aeoliella sp. TaxID=2795800 RepID=UPI003CCC2924
MSIRAAIAAAALGLVCLVGCSGPNVDESIGPVADRTEWPKILQEMVESTDLQDSDLEDIRVYCFGDFIDSAHMWQHHALPSLRETTITRLHLVPSDSNNQEVQQVLQGVPDTWPAAAQSDDVEYYVRRPFKDGNDGSHCVLVHDKGKDLVTVWFLFVF